MSLCTSSSNPDTGVWYDLITNNAFSMATAYSFDYEYLIEKFDLINRRNAGEFDQVWINSIDPVQIFVSKDAAKAISRSDFAAVSVKLYEALTGKRAKKVSKNPFVDTNDEYVLKAYNLEITTGVSETRFGNGTITREQMATMIVRSLSKAGIDTTVDLKKVVRFADDEEMHDWSRNSVCFMANEKIIKGVDNNKFNTQGLAKIEEALAIAVRCTETFKK